jgi:signal transduction histidine kinase
MFAQARRRLTAAYIVIFAAVIGTFSLAFLVLLAIFLEPDFDLVPETSGEEAAQIAYAAAVERIGIALVVADIAAIAVVGVGAWILAARTLGPIRDAHDRQRRFVADASHEMRTPLTAIRATTENAMRPGTPGAEQRAALDTIAAASAELAVLTADLLTLAQSDDAALRMSQQRFDLSVVVAERLELRAAAKSPAPTRTRFAADLEVIGSPEDVGRVVDNLIDNAFRYGGRDVRVEVATRSIDGQAVLDVDDDGPGIAAADQENLFDPFFRVRADATAQPGTGLGLAIAMALAKRNRGRLTVDSEVGRGSNFRLSLPLAS